MNSAMAASVAPSLMSPLSTRAQNPSGVIQANVISPSDASGVASVIPATSATNTW